MQQLCEMTEAHLFLNPQTLYFVVTEEAPRILKKLNIEQILPFFIGKKKVKQFFHTIDLFLKGRIWLLTAQKPINRLGWWKGKFALLQLWATGGW